MEYKYTKNENYEDFASGRVLYHVGGEPTFPVRLSLEIYERCLHYSNKKIDISLYDCCCGRGYMLTILGLLKSNSISTLYGSDINLESLKLAQDNLGLLTKAGISRRRDELEALFQKYKKVSHTEALHSIDRMEQRLTEDIKTSVFKRNVFEVSDLPFIPDIIITDVPYGNMVEWDEGNEGINQMMNALSSVCGSETIICVCMDKKQKIQTDIYQRLERQLIGKRKFEIYRKKVFGTLSCAKEYVQQNRLEDWVQLFLRGDGNNIELANGLKDNNFKYVNLGLINLNDLDVTEEVPEYITDNNDKEWFNYEINEMIQKIVNGWDMPPLIVHFHKGIFHPLDGRHRNVALHKLDITQAPAVIVLNTEEDNQNYMLKYKCSKCKSSYEMSPKAKLVDI